MRGPKFFKMRAGRRDANHAEIRDGLEALGHVVLDLASVGSGISDLAVLPLGAKTGRWVFLEVKIPKGKIRTNQVEWRLRMESRGVKVATVVTLAEALEAIQ